MHSCGGLPRVEIDGSALGRVSDRVREQIRDHLLDAILVGDDRQRVGLAHPDRVPVPERLHAVAHLLQQGAQIELGRMQLHLPRVQSAGLQQVADQPVEPIDLLRDQAQRARGGRVGPALAELVQRELGLGLGRRERGLPLMDHVGQEDVLGLGSSLRARTGRRRRAPWLAGSPDRSASAGSRRPRARTP